MSWDTAVAELENRGMEFIEFRPSYFGSLFGNAVVTREELIRDNPKMVVGMCRGIAKAVHFGLNNPDAAVRIHWKLYPQSKPQGTDEAKLLERFAPGLHVALRRLRAARHQEIRREPRQAVGRPRGLMKEQGLLPADFDVKHAYTNEFVDQINDWDRGRVEAQAKAWVPA